MTIHEGFSLRLTATEQQCLAKVYADATGSKAEAAIRAIEGTK